MRSFREGAGSRLFIGVLTITTLVWGLAIVGLVPAEAASRHTEGSVVVSGSTIWHIGATERRGFATAAEFLSHGYSFAQVQAAADGDLALPAGANMTFADGTLVNDNGTVYMVNGGVKRGFVSAAVFTGLGFSFTNLRAGSTAGFTMGANVDSTSAAHPAGSLVNASGTVWKITATGRMGVPSLEVFNSYGWKFSNVVAINGVDTSLSNEGNVSARLNGGQLITDGVPPVSGNINVSLASDNPAAGVLVAGQATADLAHFALSGSGTVSTITLKRIGVSADSTLSNIYLFDGAVRLTDAATIGSNSTVTLGGLNLAVSGSKTIAVKADIATGTSGQTVGIQMTGATLVSGTVGGLPVSGNVHNIASATLADVTFGAATAAATQDPANDVIVWQSTATVVTRDVVLSRMAFRNIGSINAVDIKNFELYVDGALVAAAAGQDANGYVTFAVSPAKTLAAGSRVIKVQADIIGGSGRTIEMSLRSKADVDLKDSQYNVNINSSSTFPITATSMAINAGSMTVVKAVGSASGNVTKDGIDIPVGTFTFTASGESIKVETLTVGFDTNNTDADYTLRNVRIMVNGSQVGSTTSVAAVDAHATGTSFTTNFTVVPGTPATVEVRTDIFDNEDGGAEFVDTSTIQVGLLAGSANGQRMTSLSFIAVPSALTTGNVMTVKVGSMSLAQTSSYPAQTTVVPKTNYKMGSYQLTGNATEDVNVNTFTLDADTTTGGTFTSADLTDVYLTVNGVATPSKATISAAGNSYSVSYTLLKNATVQVDVFANIGSTITATHTLATSLAASGVTAGSATSVTASEVGGQVITYNTGSLTEALDAASPVAAITEDSKTMSVAAFKFSSANDSFTITEVDVNLAGASTVGTVNLKDGSTIVGTRSGTTNAVFSGLNVAVASNTTKVLTVELVLLSVGVGGGTSREAVTATLDGYTKRDSNGVETVDTDNVAANEILVFAAVPTITSGTVNTTAPFNGEQEIFKWTVTPTGGTVAMKQFGIRISITDAATAGTLTLGSFRLYKDSIEVTSTVRIVDQTGQDLKAGTNYAEADTHAYITFGAGAQGEDQIASAVTYSVKATAAGFLAVDDDRFDVELASDATTTTRFLNDIDTTVAEIIATTSTAGLNAGAVALPVFTIWSDVSAAAHSAAIADEVADDPASLSTGDWTNGYLVKNLALPVVSFVY